MLALATKSGGKNRSMAPKIQSMFAKDEDLLSWDASAHHIQCYTHKINLVVGHGFKASGQKVGQTKPSTLHGDLLPIPWVEGNDGKDNVEYGDKSEE